MCLHRSTAAAGFSERDVAVVRRIAPHVAEGLRLAHVIEHPGEGTPRTDAGIVLLDDQLQLVSMNAAAEHWFAAISDSLWPTSFELPVPVYTVAARLDQDGDDAARPEVRVRTGAGDWALIHAYRMTGPSGRQTAVVIEPASSQQLTSILLAARGLTPAQERIAALVLRGLPTREISAAAHVSPHTVQEHLKAIFDKFGVRSRRELVSAVLTRDPG
jgi:DNA-binding CsgD family transcriptional regulator